MTHAEAMKQITARKWNGNDAQSWAVFIKGQRQPFVSGLSKNEVLFYKCRAADTLRARAARS